MADKRINALANTAPSTASDDFIAVDGTTNGTRKLNAFSPTFGGNATVTGTLTANTSVNSPQLVISDNSLGLTGGAGFYKKEADTVALGVMTSNTLRAWIRTTDARWFYQSGTPVTIQDTTASTSTSSGALVVGNGTNGGLGVGGAITLGSSLTSTASDGKIVVSGSGNTTGTKELQFVRADGGDSTVLGLAGSAYAGVLTGLGNNDAYLYTSSAYAFRIFVGTTNRFDFTATQFKINPTTASTTTSTGALVVSGGVGVAGAVNVGGSMKLNYFSTAGDPTALGVVQLYATTNTTSGAGGIEWKADAGGNGYGYRTLTVFDGVSAYDLYTQVRTNSASWTNSVILKSNGNATFSGSVQTSAPSGGTAAAWKLGTVATVSPTSPNRTIEVDIGGTIYYIHAKTTNN